MNILGWVLQNKLVTILSVLLFSFFISTISLAVKKNNTRAELRSCYAEYEEYKTNCSDAKLPGVTDTTTTVVTTTTHQTPVTPDDLLRLPLHVKPVSYDLLLSPDLTDKDGTFTGTNNIKIKVTAATDRILIHSNKLNISSVTVENAAGDEIENTFELIPEYELLEINLTSTSVVPSEGSEYDLVASIVFNGTMLHRIVGLYKSTYNETEQTRSIATSKFEPTFARQAFPCFDEPAMKAKYRIKLQIPTGGEFSDYHALSNMPVNETVDNTDGTATVSFEESVSMSSYLACFIVSDFANVSETVNENLTMRVFATPAQLSKTKFALDTGLNVTRFYIEYFGVDYPLPKLDMAAIPDFVSGAMEHWGLVTFRETALLYEEGISSTANKQRVATVIAHEVAHMWFGNLVTMAWWDELWLNEGFASYIEYKGTDAVYPAWKMLDQFLIDDLHSVLTLDATLASHPIVQTVETPAQITEIFDTITYNKGAAVIRMLNHFVGDVVFKESVTNYLNKHKYGNAVTDDLLTEIDTLVPDINVKHIMSTWTQQMGFPVVNVERVNDTHYVLRQERFFSNPENADDDQTESVYNYRWYIPVTYETDQEEKLMWFSNVDAQLDIPLTIAPKWIKFNKDQVGYYRVKYPNEMWTTLTNVLKENVTTFSISNRGHLLNDAFSLAEATSIGYDIALNLTEYLTYETEYVPWSVASTNLQNIKNHLYHTEHIDKFKEFGQSKIRQVYQRIGWTVDKEGHAEDHLNNQLRTTILNFACSIGLPECITEAGRLFNNWLDTNERPDPDLRNIVYYYGMASVGTEENWNKVWDIYTNETDASEKAKLIYGLSAIKDSSVLQRFIHLAWDDKNVRGQDYFTCMQNIAANRDGGGEEKVWLYVNENWQRMVTRFGLDERYLGRMIPSICGRFNTNTQLDSVKAFFLNNPEAGAGAAAREQTIQDITNRIKWMEKNEVNVAKWLTDNV